MSRRAERLIIRLFQFIILCADWLFPKDRRILIFGSHAGKYVGGNSRVLFDFIRSRRDSPFICYFFTRTRSVDPHVLTLQPPRLKTIILFLMAKTILVTHGLSDMHWLRFSRRKYYIKLWHGRPGLKGDGYSIRRVSPQVLRRVEREARQTTAFLVCSRIEAYMRAFSNALRPHQILPLGYPRNDILLRGKRTGPSRLRKIFSGVDFSRVILYAPTWRTYASTRFFPWDDFEKAKLLEWLAQHNAILLLRAHRNDQIPVVESERIRNLSFDRCAEVTEILPEVDVLVTDYSSIAADFLLLDRPIIYVPYDMEEFEENVGVCYDDAYSWMPGQVARTFNEFLLALEKALSDDDGFAGERRRVNRIINSYQSRNSSYRIFLYLKKLLGLSTQ